MAHPRPLGALAALLPLSLTFLLAACGARVDLTGDDGGVDSGADVPEWETPDTGVGDTGAPPWDTAVPPWDTSPWWDTAVPPWDTGPAWDTAVPPWDTGPGWDTAVPPWDTGPGWDTAVPPPPPPPPPCPAKMPPSGAWCGVPQVCAYANACGSTDYAICSGGSWLQKVTPCPTACPTKMPTFGAPCVPGGSDCSWDNGCGNVAYGYCDWGGTWVLKDPGCTPGCPAKKPTGGEKCSPPLSCSYLVPGGGPYCQTSCFCADDGRIACITPPCGPTVDAGPIDAAFDGPWTADAGSGL